MIDVIPNNAHSKNSYGDSRAAEKLQFPPQIVLNFPHSKKVLGSIRYLKYIYTYKYMCIKLVIFGGCFSISSLPNGAIAP